MSNKVGVLLSGCGFIDGAEIHESVLTMLHLDRAGVEIVCLAPHGPQMHVVDHATGEAQEGESRDVFSESARIARGNIRDLAEVQATDIDALIMPGGFGAAKNLSDFATAGADATVMPDVQRLCREMLAANKPIGVICISPAVLAAALKGTDVTATVTIGSDAGTAAAIRECGQVHEECAVTGSVLDAENKIVSTPAYMCDARVSEVSAGIEKLVQSVLSLI